MHVVSASSVFLFNLVTLMCACFCCLAVPWTVNAYGTNAVSVSRTAAAAGSGAFGLSVAAGNAQPIVLAGPALSLMAGKHTLRSVPRHAWNGMSGSHWDQGQSDFGGLEDLHAMAPGRWADRAGLLVVVQCAVCRSTVAVASPRTGGQLVCATVPYCCRHTCEHLPVGTWSQQ